MITGPVLLKDILDFDKYNHFILLHVAMRKLLRKNLEPSELDSIQLILNQFVQKFRHLYGLNKITYVTHQLIHLCDEVEQYGSLKSA